MKKDKKKTGSLPLLCVSVQRDQTVYIFWNLWCQGKSFATGIKLVDMTSLMKVISQNSRQNVRNH